MTKIFRQEVCNFLEEISFPKKNAKQIEGSIFKMCEKLAEEYEDDIVDIYSKFAYEKIGEIYLNPKLITNIMSDINNSIIDWESISFLTYKQREDIDHSNRAEGPKIQEGVFQCKNCLKFKCYYYQIQDKSCDEPLTTYVACLNCGKCGKFS
jgi:DNA-directed RNA polymerase subunit M/transcription elongation factor TFIIS